MLPLLETRGETGIIQKLVSDSKNLNLTARPRLSHSNYHIVYQLLTVLAHLFADGIRDAREISVQEVALHVQIVSYHLFVHSRFGTQRGVRTDPEGKHRRRLWTIGLFSHGGELNMSSLRLWNSLV